MRTKSFAVITSLLALAAMPASAAYQFKVPAKGLAVSAAPAPAPEPPKPAIQLTLQAPMPPVGQQGKAYSFDVASLLSATNAPGFNLSAVSWEVAGTLPPSITFSNGVFSGTATQVALSPATVQVQATYEGVTATQSYAFKVAPLDTLLLSLGSNGGTASTTDLAGHSVTPGATFVASSAQVKYGTSAGYFTKFSELSIPYSADFQFDGDFTIEAWANVTSTDSTWSYSNGASTGVSGTVAPFIGQGNPFSAGAASAATVSNFDFGFSPSTKQLYFARRTGSGTTGKVTLLSSAVTGFSYNTWHHYAVSRAGSTLYFAYDGQIVGTQTLAGALNAASSAPITVGRTRGGDDQLFTWFNGYMQDVRVTKGYARYTGAFTPPAAMSLYE